MLFVLPLEATSSEASFCFQVSLQKYSVVILTYDVSSCSVIWPVIQDQPCASLWHVRKHLSGQGQSCGGVPL